jgi:hypothetical protein
MAAVVVGQRGLLHTCVSRIDGRAPLPVAPQLPVGAAETGEHEQDREQPHD